MDAEIVMPVSRGRKAKRNRPPPPMQPPPKCPFGKAACKFVGSLGKILGIISNYPWTAFVALSVFLGVVGGAYTIAEGPPWPTTPLFSAQVPSFGSPFDAPFDVTNKSGLFDIHNLTIHCEIISLLAKRITVTDDFKGKLLIPASGPNPVLRATQTAPFTCPFLRALDGVGLGRDAADSPRKARILFVAEYDSPWKWIPWVRPRWDTASDFTLDTNTQPPRWVPGIPLR
jgi:hypothetical protein